VGCGADLGTPAMTNIFHNENQFLRTTKMKLVHSLGEIDKVLDIELNEHVGIPDKYITLRNILRSFRVKDNQVILTVKKETLPARIASYTTGTRYMVDLLGNILYDHINYTVNWAVCDSHYRYNTSEKVNPDDIMRSAGNSSLWKSYAAGIGAGTPVKELEFDLN
jgi:3-methyladenine DNA glycosylase AlkD